MDQQDKARRLRELHFAPEILVLANAWDAGSAMLIARAGFPAIATTSSGVEFSAGLPGAISERRDGMLAAVRRICAAVDLPVTVDIESGFAGDPDGVGATVAQFIEAGVVGVNIEDTRDGSEIVMRRGEPFDLYPVAEAVERIAAARRAAERAGLELVINGRTDTIMAGRSGPDTIAGSIERCNAYLAAGADCAYVPFASDAATIAALVDGINGPLNILGGPQSLPVAQLQSLGVARVSIGGSLSRAAARFVERALDELREHGTYGYAADAMTYEDTLHLLRQR